MTIAEMLLPEFDQEMASTRKVLERVPEGKFEWKGHGKSNTIGWVTRHLADIPGWIPLTMGSDSLDIHPPGGEGFKPSTETSIAKILATFDANVAAGRAELEKSSDARFAEPWTLLSGGEKIFTMPKYNVVRSMVLNHAIHHRAHLLAYLRQNDVKVPGMYGPSGDE
jgi:uncharacterized damage-inducible protein DinB